MATITEQDLQELARLIVLNIKEEFAIKHLSKNLINTIRIENMGETVNIHIPARVYDMLEYKRNKVIKYTGNDSYASSLDEQSKNHTGYVNKALDKALQQWKSKFSNAQVKKEEF